MIRTKNPARLDARCSPLPCHSPDKVQLMHLFLHCSGAAEITCPPFIPRLIASLQRGAVNQYLSTPVVALSSMRLINSFRLPHAILPFL